MANEQERNPGSEQDISKSQSQQQPQGQSGQQREKGEAGQFETGQEGRQEFAQNQGGSPDEGTQGDTLAQQRTDVEGGSLGGAETGESESGFVGSQGQQDSSSELIDDEDQEFSRDGQGASERE